MLCCGILALLVGALSLLWRRLRATPAFLMAALAAAIIALPVLAYAWPTAAEQPDHATFLAQAMDAICGR